MDEELFELSVEDAQMLLDYIAGDTHIIDMSEFNVLVAELEDFVDGLYFNETLD